MSGVLFDTNVLLDIATKDERWFDWSKGHFISVVAQAPILINPIIYAELAPAFGSAKDLDEWLNPQFFLRLPLPYEAGWAASQAYLKYRRAGGARNSPLPDFYIGAHAEIAGLTLVSREVARYHTYFSESKAYHPVA